MRSSRIANYITLPDLEVSELEEILYFDKDKAINLAMHAMFNDQAGDAYWSDFWNVKKQKLMIYLQKLNSKFDKKTIYELTVGLQSFINSRDYNIPGKYKKSELLGISLVTATPAFREFNVGLTEFIQKMKPKNHYSWVPKFSDISGMLHSVVKNISHLSPLQTFIFVISCQTLAAQAQVIPDGAVAYFPFNGNALDESGHDNDGIIYGATFVQDRFGNNDSAVHFSGGSYIKGDASNLPPVERSASVWFKPKVYNYGPGLDRGGFIFGYGGNSCAAGQSFIMLLNNKCGTPPNNYDVQSHCALNRVLYYNNSMFGTPGEWTHYAMTSGPSGTKVFVNGQAVGFNDQAYMHTYVKGREFVIAAAPGPNNGRAPYTDGCGDFFQGDIDDIRIYSRVLSDKEVISLYGETQKIIPITPPPASPSRPASWYERYEFWLPAAGGGAVTGLAALCMFKKQKNRAAAAAREELNQSPQNEMAGNLHRQNI